MFCFKVSTFDDMEQERDQAVARLQHLIGGYSSSSEGMRGLI